MDEPRVRAIREKTFFLIFPLTIFFFALYPYSLWHSQILILISLILFLGIKSRSISERFDRRSLLLFSLIIGMIFISTLLSINKINSVPAFFSYLVIFFLLINIPEEKTAKLVIGYIYAALLLGFISSAYSLTKIISNRVPQFFSIIDNARNLIIPYFGHAFYAIFLIMAFPFVLDNAFKKKSKYAYIIFLLYCLFILLSFSRAAILLGVFQIAGFFFLQPRKTKITLRAYFWLGLTILLFAFFIKLYIPNNYWLKDKFVKDSIPSRLEYWHQGLTIIKNSSLSRLLLGYGADTFYELSHKFQTTPDNWSDSLHNYFLQFLIENGILASAALFLFLLIVFANNFNAYGLAEKISLISVFIHSSMGTVSLNIFPVLLLFFLLLMKKRKKLNRESLDTFNENEAKAIFSLSRGPRACRGVRLSCDKNCVAKFLNILKQKIRHRAFPQGIFRRNPTKLYEFRSCHSDPDVTSGEESLANASSETSSEILRRSTPQDDRKCETRKLIVLNYINIFLIFIISLFWLRYVVAYTYFFVLDRSEVDAISLFPYEASFWSKIINSNQFDSSELNNISGKLRKYSESNVELSSLILNRVYEKKDHCLTLRYAKEFLLINPFDTAGQNQMMSASGLCPNSQRDLMSYLKKLKSLFGSEKTRLQPVRPFLQFAAATNFNQGEYKEYQWWFAKAWTVNVNNNAISWLSELVDDPSTSLSIKEPFKAKIKLLTMNDLGGIVLQGVQPKEDGQWWDGVKAIFIGTGDYGKRLYVDARYGLSKEPDVLFEKRSDKKFQSLTIFFDKIGSQAMIQDESGEKIAEFSIPTAIFPDNRLFIGYGLAAYTNLSISDFSILTVDARQ